MYGEGIPDRILGAELAYRSRRAQLDRLGLSREDADATILAEAQEAGGVLAPGETINLTSWSEHMDIARPVLEALALSIHRKERASAPSPESAAAAPAVDDPAGSSSEPGTPPPLATRRPKMG